MMELKPENLELQNKIMDGAKKAYQNLVIAAAQKNEELVIADDNGNVLHIPAKDLLKQFQK